MFYKTNSKIIHIGKNVSLHQAIVGDHVTTKTDGGMKEVFSKIAEKHPSSALADRFGSKSNAKVKPETIAKKHGLVSKTGGQDLSKRFKKNKDTGLY